MARRKTSRGAGMRRNAADDDYVGKYLVDCLNKFQDTINRFDDDWRYLGLGIMSIFKFVKSPIIHTIPATDLLDRLSGAQFKLGQASGQLYTVKGFVENCYQDRVGRKKAFLSIIETNREELSKRMDAVYEVQSILIDKM